MNTLTTQEYHRIENHFETRVNRQSRAEMIAFLSGHFRYDTMNSCNKSTSYAHCIKIHLDLGLPDDIAKSKYNMVFNEEWLNHMSGMIDQFSECQDRNWAVGTNGRSSGYLVLYQCGIKNGRISCYSGRSVDQDEDFHDWDMDQLIAKVDLICDFDMSVANIVIAFVEFCRTYNVVEETIMVPKKVYVLQEKE